MDPKSALAEPTCNWQLSMGARGTLKLMYLNLIFMNLYFRTGTLNSISKLSAKYQFCAIHTADNTDGKVTGGG